MEVKSDQMVEVLGNIGRWQWIMILLTANNAIFTGMQVLVVTFLTPTVDFLCVPQSIHDNDNTTYEEWIDIGKKLLKENQTISQCTKMTYSPNVSLVETNVSCNAWLYNTSFYPRTVITEFDLVCSRDYLVTLSQSILMSGIIFGSLLAGMASDRIGRRYTMLISSVGVFIFGTSAAFANSIELFIVLRFCSALFAFGLYTTAYCYCVELVGGRWAILVGINIQIPWAIGYSLLALIAYYVPDWSWLQLTISLPLLLYIAISLVVPESPRWLIAEGRLKEAEEVMRKALKINGKEWPQGMVLKPVVPTSVTATEAVGANDEAAAAAAPGAKATSSSSSYLDLVRYTNLRRKTLVHFYLWFSCSLVYYGLTFNAGTLLPGGDLYVNFAVSAAIEFPAYITASLILLYFGRRTPLIAMFAAGGTALFLMMAVADGSDAALALSSVGKFCIAAAFAVIYIYAAELFPTVLRNTGLGCCSVCATLGSILAPYVGRELGKEGLAAPISIFAGASMIAAVATGLLPETHKQALPDTVEEGEAFGKGDSLFNCRKNSLASQKVNGKVNKGYS